MQLHVRQPVQVPVLNLGTRRRCFRRGPPGWHEQATGAPKQQESGSLLALRLPPPSPPQRPARLLCLPELQPPRAPVQGQRQLQQPRRPARV